MIKKLLSMLKPKQEEQTDLGTIQLHIKKLVFQVPGINETKESKPEVLILPIDRLKWYYSDIDNHYFIVKAVRDKGMKQGLAPNDSIIYISKTSLINLKYTTV